MYKTDSAVNLNLSQKLRAYISFVNNIKLSIGSAKIETNYIPVFLQTYSIL